jgi:signal transduction histidine kinase
VSGTAPARPSRIVRKDDLWLVSADDAVPEPVDYRFPVTQQALVRAKDYVFDAAALAGVVATQVQVWSHADHPHTRLAVMALLAAGALLFRRVTPLVAPLVSAAGVVAFSFVDAGGAYDTSTLFVVLLLGAWAAGSLLEPPQSALAIAAVLAAGWIVMLRAPGVPLSDVLLVTLPVAGLFAISASSARRAEQARRAEARARRTEKDAQRAIAEERNRITRELHDVLAHSVSVMTVQASAVRLLLKPDQDREREALLTVEQTGREALAEMRRLVGIMRTDNEVAALSPQPGIGTLPQLLEQVRASGLPVELTVEGTPVRLPAGVDLSAYRIVQEALASTLEHARSAHAWVAVRYAGDDVEIEVANDGDSDGGAEADGDGLVGVRERVAMCGGVLRSGPRAGGGYTISARLPVAGCAG